MIIKSYSKINLSLKVNYKSRNGLHEIQSVYCLINLYDIIKINKIKKKKDIISFKGPFGKFVNNKNNTVLNSLKKLRELNLISSHYAIDIRKNIPVFAGLGGGTSNAAFILKNLLKDKITNKIIKKFEILIGSDLRLYFKKQGFLKNLKKIIEFKKKQKFYFVLIKPNISCSTKDIYAHVKNTSKKEQLNKNITKSRNEFLEYLFKSKNELQFVVEKKFPIIKKILKDIENEKGCFFARMTGSGSVCYGLFKDQIDAKKALNRLKKSIQNFGIH